MKVVLAGAFGHLGEDILRSLVRAGHEVVAADLVTRQIPDLSGYRAVKVDMTDKSALRAAAATPVAASAEPEVVPINVDESTVYNITITNGEKFEAFIAENATIDIEAAKAELQAQLVANSKATKFVLAADKAKDGAEHEIAFQGIAMLYDNQGTQLGGGKAYLDKGQAVARVDMTFIF